MERIRLIEHRGQTVALLDFSAVNDPADWHREVENARALVARHPPDGTLLTLTDVSDVRYDKEIVQLFKQLAAHNKPYVRAAAVVASSALNRSVIAMVGVLTKRKLQAFDARPAALEWLVQQR